MHKRIRVPENATIKRACAIITCFVLLPLSTQALAGADPSSVDALADQAAPAASAGASSGTVAPELTEVQVTGTRIIRQGYEAPTPVTAVGIADLQANPSPNISDTLQQLPQFQGSVNSVNTSRSDNEGAQSMLNLRNLNPRRTLILFDGRRLPTANQENVPDLTLVPDALVQRVDVVTGGASAVYGSDAVAGVVNYVLDTNFTGIKGLIQGGISGYGDGPEEKVQLTGGTKLFNDRLHILLSASETYQGEVLGSDRPWNTQATGLSLLNNPAYVTDKSAPQYLYEPCCVTAPGYYAGGVILNGPLLGTAFGVGGAPFQYNLGYGITSSPGNGLYGGDWQLGMNGQENINAANTVRHFFARAGFDLTPDMQVYVEWIDGADHTVSQCCRDYYPSGIGTLYTSNPFIPQSVLDQAATAGVTSFKLGTSLQFPWSYGVHGALGVNDYRFTDAYVVGLKGKLHIGTDIYNWDLYAQQGNSVEQFAIVNESIKSNLSNAIEAVRVGTYGGTTAYTDPAEIGGDTHSATYTAANFPNPLALPAGTITCASNLLPRTNPAATSNCAPFNVFGLGMMSPAAINYTQGQATLREVGNQTIFGGSITGEPFSDWAGPVSIALDAEYRHESIAGFGDPLSQYTGYFSTNFFPYFGSQWVAEGAIEAVVPLLRDLPFVQELDANAGARATDYSTSGYVTTYKLGLQYAPINDLRFRATYSEDIRAPNLFDLYGNSNGHGPTEDPFFNYAVAPAYTVRQGNPDLQPEKAHQYEIGLVFQPSEVPGLNFSVDYWHIKITGAIDSLTAAYELQQCKNTQIGNTFSGTSSLCNLITRNSDNTLNSVTVIPFNLASFLASGVDYAADYRKALTALVPSWKGAIDLHLAATNTQHDITNTGIPGPAQVLDAAGTFDSPRWALFGTLTYELDPWRFSWTERYYSSVLAMDTYITCSTNCPNPLPAGFTTMNVVPRDPTYFLASATVNYKFLEHDQQSAEAFVSVNNVFNKIPPFRFANIRGYGVVTNQDLYDSVGLYARAGIRFRF